MHTKVTRIAGLKALEITHPEYRKKSPPILIIDCLDNIDIEDTSDSNINKGTLLNICYSTCKYARMPLQFYYVVADRYTFDKKWKVLAKAMDWKGAVFHDRGVAGNLLTLCEGLNRPFSEKVLNFFRSEGLLCTISVPLFGTLGKFEKGGGGPNILGFVLKSYVQVATSPFYSLAPIVTPTIRIIDNIERFRKALARIEAADIVSVDTETNGLNRVTSSLLSVQFGLSNKLAYCLPMSGHSESPWSREELDEIKTRLNTYFSTSISTHLMQNGIFDVGQLSHHFNIKYYSPEIYDMISGESVLDENLKFLAKRNVYSPYSLETIEIRYGLVRPQNLISKDQRNNMASFSMKEIAEYGGYDVTSLFDIKERQEQACVHPLFGFKNVESFHRVVLKQLSPTIKVIAILQNKGMRIDVDYLLKLVSETGLLAKEKANILNELYSYKSVQTLNKKLLKEKGLGAKSLFGGEDRLFDLNKPAHKRALFFNTLKLEPVNYGKSIDANGDPVPSADKEFQKTYAPQNEVGEFLPSAVKEVACLVKYSRVSKLKAAFADAIMKRIITDQDFIHDKRLRSSYGFIKVLGGRLNSYSLNMQQIPSRGPLSKILKAAFIAAPKKVIIGSDFSAHEVRVGGIIAKDSVVEKIFKAANEAIREYRLKTIISEDDRVEARKVLERKGDIHLLNIEFFYGLQVDKKHPLRNQIKAIVFGVLYGKMAKNLAKSLDIEINEAEALLDKLFVNWAGVKKWIDSSQKSTKKSFMYHYPNDRIRHLWGYLSADEWVHFAMNRRAINSPIQGFASDIGVIGIDQLNKWVDRNIWKKDLKFDFSSVNMIHDAQYSETDFKCLPLAVYLTEHAMSTMPMDYYKKEFNYDINIPLSYDIDFGRSWASLKEWDKRTDSLLDMIKTLGQELEEDTKPVLEDAKLIMNIREQEVKENPYKMAINSKTSFELFNRLNMFKGADV